MATASGDTIAYGDQDFLARREFVYCNVDLHGGVQRLHPYVLMQAVVELRSTFTVRDVPLENIRDKRIFVLVDPNVERAAPALGSLRGKGARLVVATHLPDPPGGSTERLSLEFAEELSRVLGLRVIKLDSAVGPEVARAVFDMRADEVVLLENLSIFKEDAANDVPFARQLGMLCEVSRSADASPFAHLMLFGDAAIDIIAGRKLAAVEALHVGGLRRNERSRKRVLVPVDGSAHAREAAGLVATHVDFEKVDIHLLYVHASESGTAELRSDPNELARMNAEAKMASLPVFEQITAELGRYGLAPRHQVIRQGDPGEQILKYADDIDAELIVMRSHGRSNGLGLMLGSASQQVVDNAPCPVLVARIQSARNRRQGYCHR